QSITHKFSVGGHEGYIHVGMYEDGAPGEIFIRMAKEGSTISGLMDSFATAISLSLQHGVPLKLLVDKFSRTRFEPSGFTGNPDVPRASSIMDYIFRWLAHKFPNGCDERSESHPGGPQALPRAAASKRGEQNPAVLAEQKVEVVVAETARPTVLAAIAAESDA